MKMQIFSVFDSKSGVYAQPNFMLNKAVALRAWEQASNDPQTAFYKNPGDYTMFHVGTYDDETATFETFEHKINLGTALEFQAKHHTKEGNA